MHSQTFDKTSDLIAGAKHIGIVLGEHPSVDTTAAALSLYLSIEASGKKVDIIGATAPTVALGNLVGVNKIKQHQGGNSSGLIISLPYQQGAIEKISYDIVGDRINLTVVPGPQGLTFTTDDITYQTPSQQSDLLISVGVPSEQEVSTIANDTQSPLINIDNSTANEGFGTVALLDPAASSRSEIVGRLLSSLGAPIDTDIAQNLLSGIVAATDNFQREDTAASAFEVAAMLIAKGAKRMAAHGGVKDSFIGSEEAKLGDGMPSRFPAWQQRPAHVKRPQGDPSTGSGQAAGAPKFGQPAPKATQTMPPTTGTQTGKSSPPGAPKDWFEPKIYKGSRSTPIS